jgi:glutathione S-transferase
MSITFYAGSGSPPSWKVWLTLEHKKIPYQLKMLSFDAGDQKKPEFLAINPRGLVPTLVDDDFVIAESSAIAEYLEERWPEPTLLPGGPRERATIRRRSLEVSYLDGAFEELREHTVNAQKGTADPAEMPRKVEAVVKEIAMFERAMGGEYVAGNALSLADFSLYPLLALIRRIAGRFKVAPLENAIGPKLGPWMARIEALPYFERTYPPHWKG